MELVLLYTFINDIRIALDGFFFAKAVAAAENQIEIEFFRFEYSVGWRWVAVVQRKASHSLSRITFCRWCRFVSYRAS